MKKISFEKIVILLSIGLFSTVLAMEDRQSQEGQVVDDLVYAPLNQTFDEFQQDFSYKYSLLKDEAVKLGMIDADATEILKRANELMQGNANSEVIQQIQAWREKIALIIKNNFAKSANMQITFILASLQKVLDEKETLNMNYLMFSKQINAPSDIPDAYIQIKKAELTKAYQLARLDSTRFTDDFVRNSIFAELQLRNQVLENFYAHLKQNPALCNEYRRVRNNQVPLASVELVIFFYTEVAKNMHILSMTHDQRSSSDLEEFLKNVLREPLSMLIRIFGDVSYFMYLG